MRVPPQLCAPAHLTSHPQYRLTKLENEKMDEVKIEAPDGCADCPSLPDGTCEPGEEGHPSGGISKLIRAMMRRREPVDPSVTQPIIELPGGSLVPGSRHNTWSEESINELRDMIASDLGIIPLKAHEVTHGDWSDWAPMATRVVITDKDGWRWNTFPTNNSFRAIIKSTHDFF